MQAEINKYFPTDVSNLILEMHYKSMFNDCLSFIIFISENETCLLSGYDSEYEDDEFQTMEICNFREICFSRHKFRTKKYIQVIEDDSEDDSENDLNHLNIKHILI